MKHEIRIKKHEERIIPYVWINGKEELIEVSAELLGENANLHIVGIFIGSGSKEIAFNASIVHGAKKTKSRTTIRGVFFNHASFNNDGMISIMKGAKGADGFFSSKVLLFDSAKGRSVPSLEIDENEVKAGHASTVGRPEQDQLFYLMSRGLSEKQAIRLIISGFFEPIIKFLPEKNQKEVQKQITHAI